MQREEENAAWARTEVATLAHTRDSFNALLDELLSSLDDLDRRHIADVGYLVFRLVGTNQFYERRRKIVEEQAIVNGSKVRVPRFLFFILPAVSLEMNHDPRVVFFLSQALRSKATELVSAQLAALDASIAAAPGGFAASISSIAAAIPRR